MSDKSTADLPTSLYVPVDDDVVLPTAFSRGPWDPASLHGGPVAALLAHLVEQLHSDEVDWFVSRLTVELERPVPIEPLRLHAEVTRPGRKVSIVEATITRADSGVVLARARALRIRTADVALPVYDHELAPFLAIEPPPPGPEQGRAGDVGEIDWIAFHNGGAEHRFVDGAGTTVGPVVDWIRLRVPLIPDLSLTPLVRVAAAVDFANGISHVLPWESYLFVNPDLTVHQFRPLRGEWVGMASATHHGDRGVGMSDTAVFDIDGRIGRSNQSLLLDMR
jgi:Acyl-CoA thioesterase C-terminal domain/Acyl-CoA thioesterase N-terminal domain